MPYDKLMDQWNMCVDTYVHMCVRVYVRTGMYVCVTTVTKIKYPSLMLMEKILTQLIFVNKMQIHSLTLTEYML
jgi:hypothetical protein